MLLFCVDFSKNNLLTKQINLNSLYSLPVMNKLLIEHQLINFADLSVEKVYLIGGEKTFEFSLFDIMVSDEKKIYKELLLAENEQEFIAFRNDVYFEFANLKEFELKADKIISFTDKDGQVVCVMGSVGQLKKLYNKNISVSEIFKVELADSVFGLDLYGCYINHLRTIKEYRILLSDILNGKTSFKPPFVAEGIFTDGVVPKGDFSIIPPVYLGDTVQIESGSVIGPDTVIYNNILISENTSVKNSVLFENVFISSNCYIDGTVCCDNASIKRKTAVFSGSVIGSDALVGEDVTLDNGSMINKSVRYENFNIHSNKNGKAYYLNNKFQGLTPDKVSLLGSAVAVVFNTPKIVVGCDGSSNALSLKLAFMSGLIASGNECIDVGVTYKAQIFFSAMFCNCDYSAFFSGMGGGTDIELFNSENSPVTKTDCYNLFDFIAKGEYAFQFFDKCRNIRQISGLRKMYIREITAFSDDDLPLVSEVYCENKILLKTIEEILKKCTDKSNDSGFIVYINERGTNVNIKFKERFYTQKILKKLVYFSLKNNVCSKLFESDFYKKLWRYDSVILMLAVLNIIKTSKKELDILISELPDFYIKTKKFNLKYNNSKIAERLNSNFDFKYEKGEFKVKCNNGFVKIINNRESEIIKIMCASKSMGVSEEICNFFEGILQ